MNLLVGRMMVDLESESAADCVNTGGKENERCSKAGIVSVSTMSVMHKEVADSQHFPRNSF